MITEFEKLGGTYHDQNGCLVPDLIVPESPRVGKWVRRYLYHLKTEKRALYQDLYVYQLKKRKQDILT